MKKIILLIIITMISISCSSVKVPAPDSKPDQELIRDEADLRIEKFQANVNSLQATLDGLNTKNSELKAKLEQVNKSLKDCNDEIKRLIGLTDEQIADFAQRLGKLEGKIREMQKLSEAALLERQEDVKKLEAEYLELRTNKASIMPQFFNRVAQAGKDIKNLYREKKITTYTVGTWAENKDCLWNIAGKIEIYADPFMWPKIWQGNTDQIRNPDIIHPGQVLQIPEKGAKTSDEMKAERKYWRNTKAQQAENQAQPAGTTKGN